ncbi:hypothetical protein EVAR_23578_1 [Eumeta japonica]|uniref:Uncharacterized protein n=1 Tax=Eumeta variegata TaxID=151549 RepID=A0A4C1X196_EUMVA|nr:hypothetical protein EVAR_23578_1 [Eumeta japonica]
MKDSPVHNSPDYLAERSPVGLLSDAPTYAIRHTTTDQSANGACIALTVCHVEVTIYTNSFVCSAGKSIVTPVAGFGGAGLRPSRHVFTLTRLRHVIVTTCY